MHTKNTSTIQSKTDFEQYTKKQLFQQQQQIGQLIVKSKHFCLKQQNYKKGIFPNKTFTKTLPQTINCISLHKSKKKMYPIHINNTLFKVILQYN